MLFSRFRVSSHSLLCGLALALSSLSFSSNAFAQESSVESSTRHKQGGYAYLGPAGLSTMIGGDLDEQTDVSYRLALGGGYLFTFGKMFALEVGGAFEFVPVNYNLGPIDGSFSSQIYRFLGEARPGVLLWQDRIFAYGRMGLGLGLYASQVDSDLIDPSIVDTSDTNVGFSLVPGFGVQVMVWKMLGVGTEFDFPLYWGQDDADIYSFDWSIYAYVNF